MNALVVKNFGEVALSITAEAALLRSQALEKASHIKSVTTAAEQAAAVEAIALLKGLSKKMEASREDVKRPVITLGRQIESMANEYKGELETVAKRINDMVQAFFREEARKAEARRKFAEDMAAKKRQREAEEARLANEEAERLRQQAQQAETVQEALNLTAKAQESEQIAEQAEERAAEIAPAAVAAPAKAAGMIAKKIWKHRITDIHALYKARPDLVTLEPKTNQINATIRQGGERKIPGLEIYEEIDTSVRS